MEKYLNKFYAPFLEIIGSYFLSNNIDLNDITIGTIKIAGNNYFKYNLKLSLIITSMLLKEQVNNLYNSSIIKIEKISNPLVKKLNDKLNNMTIKEHNTRKGRKR